MKLSLAIALTTSATLIMLSLILPLNGGRVLASIPGFPSIPGISSSDASNLVGGKIESSKRCDILCTESFQGRLIHVSNPKGGDFITDFSSKVYKENDFSVGNYVIGLAQAEEKECKGVTKTKAAEAIIKCIFGDCDPKNACKDHGSGKVIKIIGTSK